MSSVLIRKALAFLLAMTMLLGLMPGAMAEEIVYEESLPEELTSEEPASEESISEEQMYEGYDFAEDEWELNGEESQATGNDQYVPVRFLIEPAQAVVHVYDPVRVDEFGSRLEYASETDGTFLLPAGEYLVDVFCDGYEPFQKIPLTVADQPLELPAVMTPIESQNLEGSLQDEEQPDVEEQSGDEELQSNKELPVDEELPGGEELHANEDLTVGDAGPAEAENTETLEQPETVVEEKPAAYTKSSDSEVPVTGEAPIGEEISEDDGKPDKELLLTESASLTNAFNEERDQHARVRFTYEAEGGEVSVRQGDTAFTAEEDGSFLLSPGEYSYQFQDKGNEYKELEGQFTVKVGEELNIPLFPEKAWITSFGSMSFINPIYADVISEADLPQPGISPEECLEQLLSEVNIRESNPNRPAFYRSVSTIFTSVADAGAEVKRQLLQRESTITVRMTSTEAATVENWKVLCSQIFQAAVSHTGNPKEGDYIFFEYGGYNVVEADCFAESRSNGANYFQFAYAPLYYTSAAQENEVDAEATRVLNSLNLAGKSQYQKVYAIYNYLADTVSYDRTNSGNTKYTAYAALVKHTSVCQGYATAMYRLLLEAGVDTRIISSTAMGHAWNIVGLDGKYYEADATWDAREGNTDRPLAYFLIGRTNWLKQRTISSGRYTYTFGAHSSIGDQYNNSTFAANHPLSNEDCQYQEFVQLATPVITGATAVSNGVRVTWNAVSGAEKYWVCRRTSSTGWTGVATVTGTSYTDTTVTRGNAYIYTIRCATSDGRLPLSGYDETGKTVVYGELATPVITGASAVSNGIKVTWNAVSGAEKYWVCRRTSSTGWTGVATVTGTSYTDTTVTRGNAYIYTIRCATSDGRLPLSGYDETGKTVEY